MSPLRRLLLATLALAAPTWAYAQEAVPAPSPYLFGDADGSRERRKERGFSHDLLWTNFYQGSVDGPQPRELEYGGRVDLYLDFDGEKLFGWTGGKISAQIEYLYGDSSFGQGGVILPTNFASVVPLGQRDKLTLNDLHITQKFSKAVLMFGKIDSVDLLAGAPMLGGRGMDGFMNLEFAAPVSGLVPPVIFGGILVVPGKPTSWTFMLFDPNDQSGKSGLERPFSSGVNVGITAAWPAPFSEHGGSHSLNVTGSTAKGTDLSNYPLAIGGGDPGTKRGKWNASYTIEQMVQPGWGFFLKLSKADANPNFHDYSYQVGLGGKGLIPSRPRDRFGLGYYRFAFSRVLIDAFDPPLPLQPESGVEAFYNYEIVPGLNATLDLQWIEPAREDRDSSVFAGVRVGMRF